MNRAALPAFIAILLFSSQFISLLSPVSAQSKKTAKYNSNANCDSIGYFSALVVYGQADARP